MRDKGRWRPELWEIRDRKIGCMVAGQNSKRDKRETEARVEPLPGQEALSRVPQAWVQSPCVLTCPSETTAKIPGARACTQVLRNGPMSSEPFQGGPGHSLKDRFAGWIEASCGQKES